MLYQRTILKETQVTGIGLHSGKKVTLKLYPAPSNHGIKFRRTDIPDARVFKATSDFVLATENATTIGKGEQCIHTVEHLLAVFYGLGIDNIYCEVDGPEIPIMDGSGAAFVYLIRETGVTTLEKWKNFLIVLKPIRVELGDKWAEFSPSSNLVIDSTIVFPHPKIKTQNEVFEFSCEKFIRDIARARTFGLMKDVDHLKRRGLVKGGSLDNAVVLDEYNVLNSEGLRFPNEFVRHKILDILGDISLLGYEVAAKVTTFKSGHNLHNLLCKKLLETPDAYKVLSACSLQQDLQEAFAVSLVKNYSY
jgi:UDP-3-O-[3-hydroxymyristoyl] N-acetylglucosamine deacetylase